MFRQSIADLQNVTPFEKRVIELLRSADSMTEENKPYYYCRQLVISNNQWFYIYQGNLEADSLTNVKSLDGTLLGQVRSAIYWDLVSEFRDKEATKQLKAFMGE